MSARPGLSVLALAIGLLVALLKIAGSFAGAIAFFGTDALVCAAVGIFTVFHPQASRRWVVLIGGPVFAVVAFFVGVARARGLGMSIGAWWSASLLTTATAAILGAFVGGWFARRREHAGSGGGPPSRLAEEGSRRAH